MAFGFKRTIQVKGPDRFIVNLGQQEREVIHNVCQELLAALDEPDPNRNPVLRRLFPVAHTADEDINADYQEMVGADLLQSRREVIARVAATTDQRELDRATLESWMTGLNAIRLVLGTWLDVSEDRPPDLDPEDPTAHSWAIYEFLGVLVGIVVDALAQTA